MAGFVQMYWQWFALVGGALFVVGWIVLRQVRPRSDIWSPTLPKDLKWDEPDKALEGIYDFVVGSSAATIGWYQARRQPKRQWGVFLRFGALLATAAAGLVPLSDAMGIGAINAVWSTVLLAIAGLFVSVDALGGFTSGWVRYMLAQQKVERCQDAFLLEWNTLKVARTDAAGMLDRAKTFLLAVGNIVDDETREWMTDFRNALKEIEKARIKAEEAERTGAIEVSVLNHQAVNEWTLEVDGTQRGRTSGRTLVVTDVLIGLRKLRASGEDANGKALSDETTMKVEGGATVKKDLQLS